MASKIEIEITNTSPPASRTSKASQKGSASRLRRARKLRRRRASIRRRENIRAEKDKDRANTERRRESARRRREHERDLKKKDQVRKDVINDVFGAAGRSRFGYRVNRALDFVNTISPERGEKVNDKVHQILQNVLNRGKGSSTTGATNSNPQGTSGPVSSLVPSGGGSGGNTPNLPGAGALPSPGGGGGGAARFVLGLVAKNPLISAIAGTAAALVGLMYLFKKASDKTEELVKSLDAVPGELQYAKLQNRLKDFTLDLERSNRFGSRLSRFELAKGDTDREARKFRDNFTSMTIGAGTRYQELKESVYKLGNTLIEPMTRIAEAAEKINSFIDTPDRLVQWVTGGKWNLNDFALRLGLNAAIPGTGFWVTAMEYFTSGKKYFNRENIKENLGPLDNLYKFIFPESFDQNRMALQPNIAP